MIPTQANHGSPARPIALAGADRLFPLLYDIPPALAAFCDEKRLQIEDVAEVRVRVILSPQNAPDAGRLVLTASLVRRGSEGADRPEVFHRANVPGPGQVSTPANVGARAPILAALQDDRTATGGDGYE